MLVAVAVPATCGRALGAAVTYQGDAAHTGGVSAAWKPPLGKKWIRRDLGDNVSYPVIGDGKVFVTAEGSGGPLLYALNRRTGGTVWVRPAPRLGLPAYDNGRVFVAGDGDFKAYSAGTGQQLWLLDHTSVRTAPVTDGSVVYVSDSYSVSSYEQITGAPVESTSETTSEGGGSGVAITDARVYTAAGCRIAMFSKALGAAAWNHDSGCGSGTFSPAVFADRVFGRSTSGAGTVLDANLGLPKDSFTSYGAPAFAGNLAYYRGATQIQARRIDTGTIVWTHDRTTGSFGGSLLVAGGIVYALADDGTLIGLDRNTGARRWSRSLGGALTSSDYYSAGSYDGMAADSLGLVVPTGSRLTALGPGGNTKHVDAPDKFAGHRTTLTAHRGKAFLEYTRHVGIAGTVRRGGEGVSDHLELQASTYPYRVWRTVKRKAAYYGSYKFSVGPERNTRYRVVDVDTAPARVAGPMQVWIVLYGSVHYFDAGGSRIRVVSHVKAPGYLKLGKHPLFVYRSRTRTSTLGRVGHLPVHRTGSHSYRVRGEVSVPSRRDSDLYSVCFPIKRWHDFGRFRSKDRCGKKHL
jgi:outer membrane protein assembly factor BamB